MPGVLRDGLTVLVLGSLVAPVVLAAAVGEVTALGLAGATSAGAFGTALGLPLACIGFVATYIFALALHEAGHALGGWLVGWRPVFAHIGPLTLVWAGGCRRVGWSWRLPWLCGRVVTAPGPGDRWRMAVFLAAGPMVNLATAAAVAPLVLGPPLPGCWAGVFAVHSLCLGLLNLLPLRDRGLVLDGLRLWRLAAVRGPAAGGGTVRAGWATA